MSKAYKESLKRVMSSRKELTSMIIALIRAKLLRVQTKQVLLLRAPPPVMIQEQGIDFIRNNNSYLSNQGNNPKYK